MSIDRAHSHARQLDAQGPCPSALELAALCDDTLPVERAGVVALHATRCDACRSAIAAFESDAARDAHATRRLGGGADADAIDPSSLARVVARAEALVDAPAPIRFARFARSLRGAVAMAASLAAAFAGWNAASYIMTRVGDASTGATVVAATPTTDDGAADSAASASAVTQLAQGADGGADADTDDSNNDLSALLTFGLLEEREGVELLDLNSTESTERSDS